MLKDPTKKTIPFADIPRGRQNSAVNNLSTWEQTDHSALSPTLVLRLRKTFLFRKHHIVSDTKPPSGAIYRHGC